MENKNISIKSKVLAYEVKPSGARNIMGCSEDWYIAYYSIRKTFSKEEIEQMSEQEVENLVRLADNISDHLY